MSLHIHNIELSRLKSPLSVTPPELNPDEPKQFLTQDWLNEAMAIIKHYCGMRDSGAERIPPMNLIRCNQGGKTRALKEIGMAIKSTMPDTVVLFVSFGDFSRIQDYEKNDLVTALCQRIAFAALDNKPSDLRSGFSEFQKTTLLDKTSVMKWLGNNTCVLLIDDVNIGTTGIEKDVMKSFCLFLKDYFLGWKGRYFVSTSDILSISLNLALHMEYVSERGAVNKELPVIRNLNEATIALKLNDQLSIFTAIYNGFIPSLLLQPIDNNFVKLQEAAAEQCCDELNNQKIVKFMRSFISGSDYCLPSTLLPFMDTTERSKTTLDSKAYGIFSSKNCGE